MIISGNSYQYTNTSRSRISFISYFFSSPFKVNTVIISNIISIFNEEYFKSLF